MPKNKEGNVLIEMTQPYPQIPKDFFFEKTQSYLLGNQTISVPDSYVARIYFKYDAPWTVTKGNGKKIAKIARKRGNKTDDEFFVIFESKLQEQMHGLLELKWSAGSVPVNNSKGCYNVASGGPFKLELVDTKKFVDATGGGAPGQYDTLIISDRIMKEVETKAAELLEMLFKNVNVFLYDAVYLTDEYNRRLEEYFFSDTELFSKYGLKLISITANTITVSPSDITQEKARLDKLASQEKQKRAAEALRRKTEEERARLKAEEEARLRAEEEAKRELEKRKEAAIIAENAALRAEEAAKAAMSQVTELMTASKKKEEEALKRAEAAEKEKEEALQRELEYQKRINALEHLVNAYRTAKAAAKAPSESAVSKPAKPKK